MLETYHQYIPVKSAAFSNCGGVSEPVTRLDVTLLEHHVVNHGNLSRLLASLVLGQLREDAAAGVEARRLGRGGDERLDAECVTSVNNHSFERERERERGPMTYR